MALIHKREAGFTLIEMAVVLVIIAVIIASGIGTLTSRVENARITETQEDLEIIRQHLLGYVYTNGYLPCPDAIGAPAVSGTNIHRDGLADHNNTTDECDVGNNVATLPWVTLGISQGDAWGTRYRYWVDAVYAKQDNANLFTLGSPGGAGQIMEPDYVADPTGATLKPMANNVVAVVFSHGKNTYGGFSSDNIRRPTIPAANQDEITNVLGNSISVKRPPTTEEATTAGGEFDDIIIWISEYELKAKMVEAGQLP